MVLDTLVVCPKCEAMNRVELVRADQSQPICGRCKTELPLHEGVQEVSVATLRVLTQKSARPVVVDFWAPWCGPCRTFSPIFQKAARELAGKFVLAKLNTEAAPLANESFKIRGIPTMIVFKRGAEVDRQSGAMPLPSLLSYLNKFL